MKVKLIPGKWEAGEVARVEEISGVLHVYKNGVEVPTEEYVEIVERGGDLVIEFGDLRIERPK